MSRSTFTSDRAYLESKYATLEEKRKAGVISAEAYRKQKKAQEDIREQARILKERANGRLSRWPEH